jgi:signal transduction histidine kinase/CheY-like chemotaxis protein
VAGASTLELIASLSDRSTRAQAACVLAARLGAEELLIFLPDPELGVLVSAPGFAQTLRGDSAWRAFLADCAAARGTKRLVQLPVGRLRSALAISSAEVVVVLLGGEPRESELTTLACALPLLAGLLKSEHQIALASAEATDAREAANRATALSSALEAARSEHAKLNAELREEHRRKDEFLAMLAHELRNPLSPLLTSLEILRHPAVTVYQRDRHINVMRRQVSQISRLVEDLLDVSRVGRGRIELKRQQVALRDVIDHALEECQPLLQTRRHQVSVSLPEAALLVDVDPVRMRQVFANLLNNAAKYTDPGGRLMVKAERDGPDAVVRIEDNGIGITADMLPRVFDLFAQGQVSIERAQGGVGIGLTLVRMLLELHGGSVAAESPGAGQGSTFIVRLPLAEVDVPARAAPTGKTREGQHRLLRVLVVDDNHDAADAMAAMLELMGHHAEVAYDGIKALQLAYDLEPDLVLLDLGLPDMDGFEVARRLKRLPNRIPRLVALTGYGADEDKRRTSEAGFDEHVIKPVTPETVSEIVDRTKNTA